MIFISDRPHNTLLRLPPVVELETKPVLKLCIKARAALGELKVAGALIPNQSVLINTIPPRSVLDSSPRITPDPRGAPEYFRYEGAGMEMIYNPATGQVGHIQPLR